MSLRGVVVKVAPAVENSAKQSRTELVTDVLGSLLGTKKKIAEPAPSQPERAEIFIQTPILKAFQVVFEIVSREKSGSFSLDLF